MDQLNINSLRYLKNESLTNTNSIYIYILCIYTKCIFIYIEFWLNLDPVIPAKSHGLLGFGFMRQTWLSVWFQLDVLDVTPKSGWWWLEHGWIMTFHWEWNNHPNISQLTFTNSIIFQRGGSTTNQYIQYIYIDIIIYYI